MPTQIPRALTVIALLPMMPATSAYAFTQEQAEAGRHAYEANCAACHGKRAQGGEAPALSGTDVMGNFATAKGLYDFFSISMPPQAPGLLGEDTYVEILAGLLVLNGAEPDGTPLTADPVQMASISLIGLGGAAAVASAEPEGDTDVPQAYTWGKSLPTADGGMTQIAAVEKAETIDNVPQAYTWGMELPKAEPVEASATKPAPVSGTAAADAASGQPSAPSEAGSVTSQGEAPQRKPTAVKDSATESSISNSPITQSTPPEAAAPVTQGTEAAADAAEEEGEGAAAPDDADAVPKDSATEAGISNNPITQSTPAPPQTQPAAQDGNAAPRTDAGAAAPDAGTATKDSATEAGVSNSPITQTTPPDSASTPN